MNEAFAHAKKLKKLEVDYFIDGFFMKCFQSFEVHALSETRLGSNMCALGFIQYGRVLDFVQHGLGSHHGVVTRRFHVSFCSFGHLLHRLKFDGLESFSKLLCVPCSGACAR